MVFDQRAREEYYLTDKRKMREVSFEANMLSLMKNRHLGLTKWAKLYRMVL